MLWVLLKLVLNIIILNATDGSAVCLGLDAGVTDTACLLQSGHADEDREEAPQQFK